MNTTEFMPLFFQALNEIENKVKQLEKKITTLEGKGVAVEPEVTDFSRVKKPISNKF